MKRVLSIVVQTLLMFFTAIAGFAAGAVVPSVRLMHTVSKTATDVRTYDFDWFAAVLLVYAILLLAGALRKRLRTTWVDSTAALALTLFIVVFLTKIGFKNTPLF